MKKVKKDSETKFKEDENIFQEVVADMVTIEGIQSTYRFFRFDKGDDRLYFVRVSEEEDYKTVLSVTSFTQKVLNNAYVLMKWQDNVGGLDIANYIKNMRAEYGTMCHKIFGEMLKMGTYDFDYVKRLAWETAFELGYKYEASQWVEDVVEDVVSFLYFMLERKVKVIGLEFPIADVELGLGGCIDLICEMEFNGKIVRAIVDFKSGRKGFFEGHELQLGLYKHIFNRHYSSVFEISHVFNFAPTGVGTKAKYKLQNQSNSKLVIGAVNEAKLCMSRGMLEGVKTFHLVVSGSGYVEDFDLEKHVKEIRI